MGVGATWAAKGCAVPYDFLMRSIALLLLVVALPGAGRAQRSTAQTPVDVFREFVAHVSAGRYADAARFLPLVEIEKQRSNTLAEARRPHREWTVEDFMRHNPDMPRVVAEYEVSRRDRIMKEYGNEGLEGSWDGVRDTMQLKALTIEAAAARWIAAHDSRLQAVRHAERSPRCRGRAPAVNLIALRFDVLGGLTHGDTTWVLYRHVLGESLAEMSLEVAPFVATLLRQEGRWVVWPTHTLLSGNGFFVSVACDSTG